MNKVLWSIKDVSEYLKINKFTVYRMAQRDQIPCKKIADQWRFTKEQIDEWINDPNKNAYLLRKSRRPHLSISASTNEDINT